MFGVDRKNDSKTMCVNHKNASPLNSQLDGHELGDRDQLYGRAPVAWHPDGFRIFLSPDRVASSDEYADSDPYTVEQNLDTDFHRRRVELTVDLVRTILPAVKGTPRILDLECGQGHITERLRQAVGTVQCVGLYYSLSAIKYAHGHFPEIDFVVGDAYDSPYAKESFDVVICNNLWEHVPDPLFLLSEINRVLKGGGYLIMSTPSRFRFENLVRVVRGKSVIFMSEHHVTEYTVGQVHEQLAYGSFEVKKTLSRPLSGRSLRARIVQRLFAAWVSLVGSHHQLEATVFYLAQKATGLGEQAEAGDGHSHRHR